MSEEILEKVKEFAAAAHKGQKRKYNDDPYIVHPVRVMEICREFTNDVAVLSSALLHDVLEDTPVSGEELKAYLLSVMGREQALRTFKLVVELTDVFVKESYPSWNRRKRKAKEAERMEKTSPEAQTVKYADIIDNSGEISIYDKDFGRVFLFECRSLLRKMDKGNPVLYKRALEKVENAISSLR
jgi:guanosine-3',5'-bis(diphosphate) 3'-pyrophosphohydrolase